eukprot:3259446-Rhodomonas_salina.1
MPRCEESQLWRLRSRRCLPEYRERLRLMAGTSSWEPVRKEPLRREVPVGGKMREGEKGARGDRDRG